MEFPPRLPALSFLVLLLVATGVEAAPVTFRVAVPNSTPPADTVFVAGDFQGWNPGHPAHALTRQPDGRWTIVLDLPPGLPIQFKFTRGSWPRVEKSPNGDEIPNRALTPQANQTYDFTVATWYDLGTVVGRVETFSIPAFLGGRTIRVYLPPGYASSTQRYPVLYMHDGQNLFDRFTSFAGEWKVNETCEALIAAGEIEPIIVVGIYNGAASRCFEYTPWPDPTSCGGGGGDAYLRLIRDVLIPEVDARYRTRTGPTNTFMSGSSLGGLITHYAGYTYPDVFGRIAAVSSSLWWNDRMMLAYAGGLPRPALARYYQDMGTTEAGFTDHDMNGIDDYIEDLRAMRQVALAQGFQDGVDFRSVEGAGHTHSETYWAQRFPDLLRFLVDPPLPLDVDPAGSVRLQSLRVIPSPAHAAARLDFVLGRSGPMRLVVLDTSGRTVRTLASRWSPAGPQVATWDLRRDDGSRTPPGVYFARLTGAGGVRSAKVVVVE